MRRLYEWPKLRGLPGHRLAPPGLATLNCMVHLIHSFFVTSADFYPLVRDESQGDQGSGEVTCVFFW